MIDQKVTIYYNSDFTARAVKLGNWSTHSKGYNFSYPVLNTIDITNLLMSGGEAEISAERMGTSDIKEADADVTFFKKVRNGNLF